MRTSIVRYYTLDLLLRPSLRTYLRRYTRCDDATARGRGQAASSYYSYAELIFSVVVTGCGGGGVGGSGRPGSCRVGWPSHTRPRTNFRPESISPLGRLAARHSPLATLVGWVLSSHFPVKRAPARLTFRMRRPRPERRRGGARRQSRNGWAAPFRASRR